ncbi:sigma factor-like helix-turn-helix DNA-binding protein [Micromonospora sp. WMMD1082]|uniref:sigma factor-like helix-turn-helix DNA-binding protein n=1 Tax=Micromonospora sp. WMMD1082 TaxID=3016104 RepID=UPI0024170A53|nr:sigma factor-like helix-turn-helix DNA-binding protein [Micromonospora sp. WMMD1082]MDG4794592.1 sigma factor-like helix-turn-helix DNA-binding protein [Micromonospora sp. WMMD1082]
MLVKRSSMLPGNGRSLSELSGMSTAGLVELARSGEREAVGELFRRYERRVFLYAVSRCDGDRAAADDVAAEVWVKVLTRVGSWVPQGEGGEDDFVRWVLGMVRGTVGEVRAARWAQMPAAVPGAALDEMDWLLADASGEVDDLDECPAKTEMLARLRAEVQQLSPLCRSVVRLRMDGAPLEEITAATGLTRQQVNDAWKRAQVRLRRRLVGRIDVESLSAGELAELLELVRELPEGSREVAALRLSGVSESQVAERLGMTRVQSRNAWRYAEDLLRKLQDDPQATRAPKGGRVAVWQKERDRLRVAAQSLSPAARRVALLRLDGLSYPRIAAQLGCTRNTVASTWSRALDAFTRAGHLPMAA